LVVKVYVNGFGRSRITDRLVAEPYSYTGVTKVQAFFGFSNVIVLGANLFFIEIKLRLEF